MKGIVLLILLTTVILFSCAKEKDTTQQDNKFTYNGMTLDLGGSAMMLQQSSNLYTFCVFSSSIAYNETTYSFDGVGDLILFSLNVPSSAGAIEGEFEYDPMNTTENSLIAVEVYLNRNFNDNSDTYNNFVATGGSIKLKYNESNELYSTEFNLILDNGGFKLKGNFKGIVQNFDESAAIR